mmetsp:Transcript_7029/g.20522  ORF Transcript_7029/g.20522 Transcript_7029/m.20522 type:complete len:142 (-) Transcript_7029:82-507(-)
MPLKDIASYAFKAAFEDRRFRPIAADELPQLEVGVSLLVEYEQGAHPFDWEVGKHGIIIDFYIHGRNYGATYLPEVAQEQGWSQTVAMESLIRKSGYPGLVNAHVLECIRLTRYQSSKFSIMYDQWHPVKGETLGVEALSG